MLVGPRARRRLRSGLCAACRWEGEGLSGRLRSATWSPSRTAHPRHTPLARDSRAVWVPSGDRPALPHTRELTPTSTSRCRDHHRSRGVAGRPRRRDGVGGLLAAPLGPGLRARRGAQACGTHEHDSCPHERAWRAGRPLHVLSPHGRLLRGPPRPGTTYQPHCLPQTTTQTTPNPSGSRPRAPGHGPGPVSGGDGRSSPGRPQATGLTLSAQPSPKHSLSLTATESVCRSKV